MFVPPKERYRLYFDETGNGDLDAAEKSPNERYLSVTGIVIRQDVHDRYTTRRLDRLKRDLFGQTPGQPIVLHRRDILRKDPPFTALKNAQRCKEFDARIAAILCEIPAPAFTVSIDKLEHKQRYKVWQYSPYHYLLECLLERFVKWLERASATGDVMGEARNDTHDAPLKRAYRRLYKNGNDYVSAELMQTHLTSSELKLKLKTANIAGLQLADLLAHPAHRALKFQHLGETLPDDYGAFVARILERYCYDRNPYNGQIVGWGTKWLPHKVAGA
jgi:hypothetical protein